LQNISTGAWLGGATTLALTKLTEMMPSWPWP
jgi:hypothetical protein